MSKGNAQLQSGVVLTFDMHAGPGGETPEDWMKPTFDGGMNIFDLLEKFDVRATFMVCDFAAVKQSKPWRDLIDLILKRHEVGAHTLHHAEWVTHSNSQQAWQYSFDEVYPNLKAYLETRQDYNLWHWPAQLTTFAYPDAVAGLEIDKILLQVFAHLRGHYQQTVPPILPNPPPSWWKTGPLTYDEVKNAGTIGGGWLDRNAFIPPPGTNPPSWWDTAWLEWLDIAARDNKFVTYGSHLPKWGSDPKWPDPYKVYEFLTHAKSKGLTFLPMGELPHVFPKVMESEPKGLQRVLSELRELQLRPAA